MNEESAERSEAHQKNLNFRKFRKILKIREKSNTALENFELELELSSIELSSQLDQPSIKLDQQPAIKLDQQPSAASHQA